MIDMNKLKVHDCDNPVIRFLKLFMSIFILSDNSVNIAVKSKALKGYV